MGECNNVFDEFIKTFFIKYDKLQIGGFHTKRGISGAPPTLPLSSAQNQSNVFPPTRQYMSVSPGKRRLQMMRPGGFNVHPNALAKYGYGTNGAQNLGEDITTGGGGINI